MWIRVAFASATLVAWGLPVRAQTVLSEAEALARFSADGCTRGRLGRAWT